MKAQEQQEAETRPGESVSDEGSAVEISPQVKVTDLAALLEYRAQTQAASGEKPQSRAETRRLRVAWPPPADEDHPGTAALSPVTEETASGRPFRPKWPPEDEVPSAHESSDRAELISLRRSSSLKERSRPFTVAARPNPAPSVGQRERRRPLKSLLEWRASLEEKNPPEEPPKQNKPELQQKKIQQATPQIPSETISVDEVKTPTERQDESNGQMQRGKAAADGGKVAAEEGSLRSISPDISASPSPPLQPKQNRASQDVGFWEEEKEGSDTEELSAEDIIKRNRYYEEEDDSDS